MEPRFARATLLVTAGLLVWAANFLFIYVFAALACARGYAHETVFGIGIVSFASTGSTVIAAAASCAVMTAGMRRADAGRGVLPDEASASMFLGRLAVTVTMLALIAIAFTGLPGWLVARAC
jgi:hypothetical protein